MGSFRQGKQDEAERPDDLYLLPPEEAITKKAGTFAAVLYKIILAMFTAWCQRRELDSKRWSSAFSQWTSSSTPWISAKLLFDKRVDGHLVVMRIVYYVDDVRLTLRNDADRAEVLILFTWGSSS